MKKLRSVLSIVLVVAMVLSLLPHSEPRTHAKEDKMEVTVQKYGYEVVNGKERVTVPYLSGAYLQVQDMNGNKVYPTDREAFISGDSATTFELSPGRYKLVEISAPDGYTAAKEPVEFTVKEGTTTIYDPQIVYTGKHLETDNSTSARGTAPLSVHNGSRLMGLSSCIQPHIENPRKMVAPYHYVSESDYSKLTLEQKEKIKRIIYTYSKNSVEAYRLLGSADFAGAGMYDAVCEDILDEFSRV